MHGLLGQADQGPAALAVMEGLLNLWGAVWPYLVMVLGFSVIIFVHELGHFAVAKWAKVRVERFAIGFGRELWGFTRGETRYSFNILPFGGYVKMLGQEDFDDKSNELLFKDDPRSFINKPVGHRMAIVSAGVVMNVLFACFCFMVVFMIGMETLSTRVGFVEPDSPADKAGLLPGDKIVAVNGSKALEYNDIKMAIQLAPPHEPVEFTVDRAGQEKSLDVKPAFHQPEMTQDVRRLRIGILPGFTREIAVVGPGIDTTRNDRPHVGDVLVEVDGVPITDDNANAARAKLAYAKEVYVERENPDDPAAPPRRQRVEIPPQLAIYPSDSNDPNSTSILGLTPLVRFGAVYNDGRAALAGLEAGDTVLNWDDQPLPSGAEIKRAVRDNPERDVYFQVRKIDGRLVQGFVRPKRIRFGGGTIQAHAEALSDEALPPDEPRALLAEVRPYGRAADAGLENGDIILGVNGIKSPTAGALNRVIRDGAGESVSVIVRKSDGRTLEVGVTPEPAGAIDAAFSLVADDWLQIGKIIPAINGRPSPAAESGIPPGVQIVAANDRPVSSWGELIAQFRAFAGSTVRLTYVDAGNQTHDVPFRVPDSLRTMLGVGPEARIVSVDGRRTVKLDGGPDAEEVSIGYHDGLRTVLTELVGKKHVPVEYRPTPLAGMETAHVDVTEDMVDPWLGRVVLAPNVDVLPETQLLKGANALDSIRIGLYKTYYFMLQVYQLIDRMFFSRSVGVENVSGPLGIVSIGGQIARAGFVEFMFFLAILSANLAVINFLPLPIVDGGLMVFLIIEKIKGSPVSMRVQVATQLIGLCLIVGVFLFVTYNDALRLWG